MKKASEMKVRTEVACMVKSTRVSLWSLSADVPSIQMATLRPT